MMKSKKLIRIAAVFLVILAVSAATIWMVWHEHNKPYIELPYCKGIARTLQKEELDFYRLSSVREAENRICFSFTVKDFQGFEYSKCLPDMIKVRKTMENYFRNEPDNELNTRSIDVRFDTFPGDIILGMYNSRRDEVFTQPVRFRFFSNVETGIQAAEELNDARSIGFVIDSVDELPLLEEWKELEFVDLRGPELSAEEKENLLAFIPDCEIVYNNETIAQ